MFPHRAPLHAQKERERGGTSHDDSQVEVADQVLTPGALDHHSRLGHCESTVEGAADADDTCGHLLCGTVGRTVRDGKTHTCVGAMGTSVRSSSSDPRICSLPAEGRNHSAAASYVDRAVAPVPRDCRPCALLAGGRPLSLAR